MVNNKQNVYKSYEKIVNWFDEHRSRELFERPYLELVRSRLTSNAKILDLGCGMGEPIAQYFIEQGFDLTGVDGSKKMIDLAKLRFPNSRFIVGDMRKLSLEEKFDLVIAWHSLFHLNQDDQRKMFESFSSKLHMDGILLFTSGFEEEEIWSDNGGENLYHASLSTKEYKKLLKDNGFEIIIHKIEDKECGDATVWMAQKTNI